MRLKLYLLVTLSCFALNVFAQTKFLQKETDEKNNITFARFSTDTAVQPLSKSVELLKNLYLTRRDDEMKISEKRNSIQDELGYTHQFHQQYYKGIKVEGGEFSVHALKGNIENVLGNFQPVGNVVVTPKLSEAQALKFALKHIDAEVYKWQIPEEEAWIKEYYNVSYYPKSELVIVKDRLKTDSIYCLAYRFDIYAHRPMSRYYVWVDAITGEILDKASRIVFSNATGSAATRYSGIRTITTDSYSGSFRLRENQNGVNISTFNMKRTGNYNSAVDFTDNDNNWTAAEFHNAENNDAGLDAHWGAEMVYEYFKQKHSRNSWDNNNGALLSYVNANLVVFGYDNDNAFWDGNRMTYGLGSSLSPFTTLDICAHEIGHGICQSTANLLYQGESGAINEALSDIWGACVENWATTNKQTWTCGEDLGFAIRSMSNPKFYGDPDTYNGINWINPSSSYDHGGVHTNSGVMNYWFYLLSQGGSGTNDIGNTYNVVGVGIDKAAKIVYRTEVYYMTSSSNFSDARTYTIQAAANLYGLNSNEVIAVTNAWHAVGIGERYLPFISGPTTSYYAFQPVVYKINNLPTGTTVTWSGSSGMSIISGQGTNQVTISISDGNPAILTASLSGTINTTLSQNVAAKPGDVTVSGYPGYAEVSIYNPYAQCFDWSVDPGFSIISEGGINESITCGGSSISLHTDGSTTEGWVYVKARNGNQTSLYTKEFISLWIPELTGYFNPYGPEPFYAYVNNIPPGLTQSGIPLTYSWYFGNNLFEVTDDPYIQSYDWPCGDYILSVKINGVIVLGEASFWGMCSGGYWSSAYPNPVNSELVIDKDEKNRSISKTKALQRTDIVPDNPSVTKVLLYTSNPSQLVYSKTYTDVVNQIRIDTSRLPSGTYYLNIFENNNKVKVQTIIVKH